MDFKDIISIAAVITTTVVAVVYIFLNHRSNLKHQLFILIWINTAFLYKNSMKISKKYSFDIWHSCMLKLLFC